VALEAEERRDQLVPHLLVIHGIAVILVVLPISVPEVDLRTHRLKKSAPPPPRAPSLGRLCGLDEPAVVLEEHLKHSVAAVGPAPVKLQGQTSHCGLPPR
jgi:hypothetical protein